MDLKLLKKCENGQIDNIINNLTLIYDLFINHTTYNCDDIIDDYIVRIIKTLFKYDHLNQARIIINKFKKPYESNDILLTLCKENNIKKIKFYINCKKSDNNVAELFASLYCDNYIEIKIVKCIIGSILDVAIDLRKDSTTLLKYHSEILSAKNMKMLYVPEGFAHGFQSLEEKIEMIYYTTEFYSPQYEGGLRYNDPKIGIEWPLEVTDISDKDKNQALITEEFKGIKV